MRVKFLVQSALLGCLALLLGAPPSPTQNPPPGPAPASGGMDERFRALDRNRDGLLSFDEMPEPLKAERDKWDANSDGHIDIAEWNDYLAAFLAQQRRSAAGPANPAPNLGGQPQAQEPSRQPRPPAAPPPPPRSRPSIRPPFNEGRRPRRPGDPPGKYPKNLPAWFKEYDADGDGQVGLYEWQARRDVLADFKKYDLNDDGFITVEELIRSGQFTANTNAPQAVAGLQADIGDFFYFQVTGSTRGTVWGSDIYTADSSLAAAAVHAGVLEPGEAALVKVTILPGQDRYDGSERNGVTTQDYGRFARSFRIETAR